VTGDRNVLTRQPLEACNSTASAPESLARRAASAKSSIYRSISSCPISSNGISFFNNGVIEGTLVRQMSNGTAETEGMVSDDETGMLYAANENTGIYKYDAEPNGSTSGELIAATGSNGLTADVEGITIYYAAQGDGYLIASSQGSNNFIMYQRQPPHDFVKIVEVTGVENTDGIDVTNHNLGPFFPYGIFLLHDGSGSPYVIRGCRWEDLEGDSLNQSFPLTVIVEDGWNMVSIPGLHPTNQNVGTWWPNLIGSVFNFSSGRYTEVLTGVPGEGYWMNNSGGKTDNYPEINIVSHDPIAVGAGWNMIGGYENIAPVSGLSPSAGTIISVVEFSGSFFSEATDLVPGYGYWITVSEAGTITIPASPLSKGSTEVIERYSEDWGRIIITDNAGRNYTLYAVNGEVNLDNYELPPLPPSGMFDIRYSSGREAEDINSSIQSIDMSGIEYPITVTVEGMDVRLQDVTGSEINENIKSGERITISNTQINKLIVTGEAIPDVYALEQNYPNPFNPSTVIEFSLPEDVSEVKLTIYDALGQRVAQLVNSSLQAGKYRYQWDASKVASGMYIYELRANKFVSIKKMMFIE